MKYTSRTKKKSKELIEKLKKYIRQNSAKHIADPNISSVGIGLKIKDGKKTNEICLQFTVNEKIEIERLEGLEMVLIPADIEIDGIRVPTDILQRKYSLAFQVIEEITTDDRKIRLDPVVPGVSICNAKGTAGTAGCIVYDMHDSTPYILSNWHVFHGHDGALGDTIVQPGPFDDNRIDNNRMGSLVRSHLGEAGDCAITTIENRDFKEEIYLLDKAINKLCEPELLDKVIKSGRTTSVTFGVVERIHVVTKINYGGSIGEQSIGCFEIGVDDDNIPDDGEISKGGDSGSVWLINKNNVPTDIMAGLHFAGESSNNPHEHALACYPKSVFEKLNIRPSTTEDKKEHKTTGYNPHFLNTSVQVPELMDPSVAFDLNGNEMIDYTHFSLTLHKDRNFAIWVAWNIDGSQIKRLSRSGISFRFDPRIPSNVQIGNDLYKNNDLDRGHIARRADLIWGDLEEAKKANKDSFYYTNIAPQMDTFNRSTSNGVWGNLENAIFEDAHVDSLRVSVIGGPIFQDNDHAYRGHLIPREYFKLIIYEDAGELKNKAFLLTQNINQLEVLDLEEFETYEISLSELEERCDMTFDNVLARQVDDHLEALEARQPINTTDQISW